MREATAQLLCLRVWMSKDSQYPERRVRLKNGAHGMGQGGKRSVDFASYAPDYRDGATIRESACLPRARGSLRARPATRGSRGMGADAARTDGGNADRSCLDALEAAEGVAPSGMAAVARLGAVAPRAGGRGSRLTVAGIGDHFSGGGVADWVATRRGWSVTCPKQTRRASF